MADDKVATLLKSALPDLLRYLVRRTSDPEHAADLLSGAAEIVWSKRAAVPENPEEARMWMFGIARNLLRTHRRSEKRRTAAVASVASHLRHALTTEAADSIDNRLDVRAAIQRLPVRLREPLILVHWDGFTLERAAAHLGVNPSTLRSRYATARARLSKELAVADSDSLIDGNRGL